MTRGLAPTSIRTMNGRSKANTDDERVYAFSRRKGRRQAVLMLDEHASWLSRRAAPLLFRLLSRGYGAVA